MIELELFQREPGLKAHTLNIWVNGKLTIGIPISTHEELLALRDELKNELLWLDDYLDNKGSENHSGNNN